MTHVRRTVQVRITNPHHTADKNDVHLKVTTFSCIKFKKKYISQSFLLQTLHHVT